MDNEFIYKVLGILLVGAVAQYIYYAHEARRRSKAAAKVIQEALKKAILKSLQPKE